MALQPPEQWLTAPMAKDLKVLKVSGCDVVKPVAVSPVTKLSKVGGQLFLPWLPAKAEVMWSSKI